MKNFLTFLFATFLFVNIAEAQAPNWSWAKGLGGMYQDKGNAIAIDAWGNVYTTGYFQAIIDFDPGPGLSVDTTHGYSDIFIIKTDSAGNFIWAKRIGGIDRDEGRSLAVDNNGNVYVAGYFEANVDFDPDTGLQHTHYLYESGFGGSFILKLDSAGNFVWAGAQKGVGYVDANSIALDNYNNVYITGGYWGVTDFDPDPAVNYIDSTVNGYGDVYVSKFDSSGHFIWTKTIGGRASDYSTSITVNKINGDVYFGGTYADTVDFDPDTAVYNLTSAGNGYNGFISKLDSSGNFKWAKSFIAIANINLVLDSTGSSQLYATGNFTGTTDFDPDTSTGYSVTAGSVSNLFVLKLTDAGNFVWVKAIGDQGFASGMAIITNLQGDIYIGGAYSTVVDFDPDSNVVFNLPYVGGLPFYSDAFVLKLNGSGNFLWAKSMGGLVTQEVRGICVDINENVFVTGGFGPEMYFDTIVVHNNYAVPYPDPDIFIARLSATLTGINDIDFTDSELSIYPNPTVSGITIKSNSLMNDLKVYNAYGQLVYSAEPKSKRAQVQFFNSGIYFISIATNADVMTRKVLVNR